ncbi:MAG: DUF3108 domain-containing protein [Rudaea sp.]
MCKLLPIVLLFVPMLALAAPTLKPERAVYSVLRDGKAIGEASYTLSANPDGSFALRSETRGSAGMAKLFGLNVREESVFTLHEGTLQGLHYDYRQDAAIKHKQRHVDFDWQAGQVHVRDNGKDFQYAIVPGCIDRSAVAVALGLAVATGEISVTLPVAVRDRVESQRYVMRGEERTQVSAGTFTTSEVERTDTQGKAKSWYAPSLGVLPVRVQQQQHDHSIIVMERK